MKKLLTILGMVLLAAIFIAPDEAQAQVVILNSPANGSQLTVDSDISVVTFTYIMPVFLVYNYQIQVSDQPDFSNIVKDATLGPVTSHTFAGLNPAKTYYWRVRANYFNYTYVSWSAWSATYNFKIVVPELLIPSNGATNQSQPLLLDWRGIADPNVSNNGHQIYVDDNADFSSPEISVKTLNNERSVSGLAYNTKFYWKVRYYYINIETGVTTYYDWSTTWDFTTGTAWLCGDVNADEAINILDVVYIINYKYKSGPAPDPMESGDVNSHIQPDGLINILDIVYLINFKYKDGPDPVCP